MLSSHPFALLAFTGNGGGLNAFCGAGLSRWAQADGSASFSPATCCLPLFCPLHHIFTCVCWCVLTVDHMLHALPAGQSQILQAEAAQTITRTHTCTCSLQLAQLRCQIFCAVISRHFDICCFKTAKRLPRSFVSPAPLPPPPPPPWLIPSLPILVYI